MIKRRIMVSYTYLTEGGNRQYGMDVLDVPTDYNLNDAAFLYVRHQISTEGVVLCWYPANSLKITIDGINYRTWGYSLE